MNKVVGFGIAGMAIWGIFKLYKLNQMSDFITTRLVNPRIHKVDLTGITIRTEVLISNPTRNTMSITQPVVTIYSNDKQVAQTIPQNIQNQINPLSETKLSTVELKLGWMRITSLATEVITIIPNAIKAYKTNGTKGLLQELNFQLSANFSTYADGVLYVSPIEKII
jgi:hypothetical protein